MPGVFITGTGTEVGKTFVAAGLLRAGRRAGLVVDALKPVLSGFDPGDLAGSDAGQLLAALGRPITSDTVAAMSPWRFAAPLSPHMAAAREGRTIRLEEVVVACRAALAGGTLTLVEGVGGVMVPLAQRHTVLDLMAALRLPVLLVSGTALGALSHCLTAYAALAAHGLTPAMIVLNHHVATDVPLQATADTIREFCAGTAVALVERDSPEQRFDMLLTELESATTIGPSRADASAARNASARV